MRQRQRGVSVIAFTAILALLVGVIAVQKWARSRPPYVSSPDCQIKGSVSSSGRVYLLPKSERYAATSIDPEAGEFWFCTEEEALRAGWRPCDNAITQ